jgi:hypothetical protein
MHQLGSSVGSIPGLLGGGGGSLPSATTSLPMTTPVPPIQVYYRLVNQIFIFDIITFI